MNDDDDDVLVDEFGAVAVPGGDVPVRGTLMNAVFQIKQESILYGNIELDLTRTN